MRSAHALHCFNSSRDKTEEGKRKGEKREVFFTFDRLGSALQVLTTSYVSTTTFCTSIMVTSFLISNCYFFRYH